MITAKKQRGLSGLGYLVILLLIGFFMTVVVKVLPIYIESWSIKKAVSTIVESNQGKPLSIGVIKQQLDKQFNINQINDLAVKEIIFKRQKGGKLLVDASYEKRVPFMQNIDVVVKFEKLQFEVQGVR